LPEALTILLLPGSDARLGSSRVPQVRHRRSEVLCGDSGRISFLRVDVDGNPIGNFIPVNANVGAVPSRASDLREGLTFLKAALSGAPASWRGAPTHLSWIKRPVPVYAAASGPA
jgi:hypothetical protein